MKRYRRHILFMALALLTIALVACGGGDKEESAEVTIAPIATVPQEEAKATEPPPRPWNPPPPARLPNLHFRTLSRPQFKLRPRVASWIPNSECS